MNGAEADAAARLLERLLSDTAFRERFRSHPVAALREAGLPGVAEEMAVGGGKLLDTLDERESRSSLAGVFMAAALEGAAMFDFSREALAHLDGLPAPVGNVLSRVNLPAIAEAQAAAPPVQGVEPIGYGPGQSVNAEAGVFPAVTPEQAAAAAARAQAPEPAAPPPPAAPPEPPPSARAADVADSAPSPRPMHVDPGQYGAEGSGGPPSPEVQSLLRNNQVTFDANGIADMKAGRMDPRIVSVLTAISQDHKITVSAMISDHDRTTSGGSVSNHYYGRAADIAVVDGQAVNPGNSAAREIATALSSLPASIRPTEVGSPWALPGTADFTDGAHQNHLHIAYDDPIASSWTPPEDLAAPGGAPAGQEVAAVEMPAVTGGSADDSGDSGDSDDGGDGGDEPGGLEDPGGDTDAEADAESDGDGDDNDSVADDASDEQESDESDSGDGGDGDHDDSSDSGSDDTDDSDGSDGGEDSGDGSGSGDSDGNVGGGADAGGQIDLGDVAGGYPGDDAAKSEVAAWMGAEAQKRGLPSELPVMAGLVESGLRNLGGGDADSVGFFQMRVGIWNNGDYAGYPDKAELQLKWFLDQAAAVKQQRVAAGKPVNDPGSYGDWIADVERPAAQYRGRYQLRLEEARGLLRQGAEHRGGGDGAGGQLEPVLDGDVGSGAGPRATAAVAEARKYLGTPYQWGGSTPKTGFDCSGLVQWAYAKAGIQIPRTSEQQILASNGRPVDRRHLLPGDLVFFRDSSGDVHHVGISLGGDRFVNAPHTGDVVKIASLKEPYYAQQFTGGRRFDLNAGRGAQAAAAAAGSGDGGYAPGVDPDAARAAEAALVRDAAEAQRPGTLLFKAVRAEELSNAKEAQVLRAFNAGPSS
jgi:putative modified peptide